MFSSFSWEVSVQQSSAQAQQYYAPQYQRQAPPPVQHQGHLIWNSMGSGDRLIVDRLAADFYERSLRYSQTQTIEQNTARAYTGATPPARAAYRAERRQQWQQMNQNQQYALRNVKRPVFAHLSESQKWPFRDHALRQLGAAGAIAQQGQQAYRPGI